VKVRDLVVALSVGLAAFLIARYLIVQAFGEFPFCKTGGNCPRLAPAWTDPVATIVGIAAACLAILVRHRWRR